MKRAARMLILLLGIVGTYQAVAAPRIPTQDGGPIPVCPPKRGPNCTL